MSMLARVRRPWGFVSTLLACSASSSISAYGFTSFDGRVRPLPQHAMSSVRGMRHRRRPSPSFMSMSNDQHDNLPSLDEINQQKREAYTALSSYHETSSSLQQSSSSSSSTQVSSLLRGLEDIGLSEEESSIKRAEFWKCHNGSVHYTVSMDPAAGVKTGVASRPYTCTISLERNEEGRGRRGLRLVETIQSDGGHIPFVRSIPLGANVDVDAVDGSYSLDDRRGSVASLPLLPSWMLGEGITGIDHSSMMYVTFLVGLPWPSGRLSALRNEGPGFETSAWRT